ncbi:hypothetical protein FHX37_1045 [Haloactinospora alba]|uniref:Uncharacterized protein n=1 Tax=Haloactinospora alba TaxID=405555 RepID=A0A543NH57_9ACTN|nr:hypothetical protein FHX37_1045 [Haloactinospora alba]
MTRPRADERADMAGHPPADDELLANIVQQYPEWEITRNSSGLVANHRHEERDVRRERAGIRTTVHAPDENQLERDLFVQRALRGDGAQL